MSNKICLSIIICTRNRAFILPDCLDSLCKQSIPINQFELILIDNGSTDQTPKIAQDYANKFRYFQYIYEPKIGLSHARNFGYHQATGPWVIYLDDDAKASANFIERALWVIEHHGFDFFGGMYYAWFKYGRPRWLSETYGTKEKLLEEVGYLEKGFASGGIMAVKKEVISKLGGFVPSLGMKMGLGYGEEDEFQMRLRANNYRLGFDPEWYIDHCILPNKLKLTWHFKAAYAQGRDQAIIFKRYSGLVILYGFTRSLLGVFWKLPIVLIRWTFVQRYYWENMLLSLFLPMGFQIGRVKGWLIRHFG